MNRILIVFLFISTSTFSQTFKEDSAFARDNFTKRELMITMRDGVKLFTAIYEPKDQSQKYPILINRTPYSVAPYGPDKFYYRLGPTSELMREKYIVVFQDVRGRYKSEGDFFEMTPAKDNINKKRTDESTDAWDTIDWLLKNTNNNGRAGLWGISYPGFYAAASLPNAHPAIKAVSPQAPVSDEFIGDDANHNGAFFLLDNFGFFNYFDGKRTSNGEDYEEVFNSNSKDAYDFFLNMGPLKNSNRKDLYNNKGIIWQQLLEHDTYDTFWKARNIREHFWHIKPAVFTIGGWFDAEDLFGALRTYEAIERRTRGNDNRIMMGPWTHGAWASGGRWGQFGTHVFGMATNVMYRDLIFKFFNFYLKDKGSFNQAEATVFETGSNKWKEYDTWPPVEAVKTNYYLQGHGMLNNLVPKSTSGFDEYVSDPAKPVPYTNGIYSGRNNEYMVEDQRFAASRPDVIVFQSDTLLNDLNVTGRLKATLYVSTTGTDADFIVKVIDVLPANEPNVEGLPRNVQMAGYQRMVRAEVFRGKFRNSFEKPEPFVPGRIEKISFDLNEIAHVFKKGHRIMIQVQSSWFPLVDRNPQKFMKIPEAGEADFKKATIRIYHDAAHPSMIVLPVVKE
ncbi:MAG TPA: CocE/NonD family hydrolase [Chitinophagaceae bacterium]|nr:CocE/NonD family hydrolase [Chitinophagaceae bacterium]